MKLLVMASSAAQACASGNGTSNISSATNSATRCTNRPVDPTIANSRKRSDTTSPVSLASTSPRKSIATLEQRQHFWQLRLVMLQVGIDHGGAGRARCQDALDASAGQAAPADPPDTADAGILPRQAPHQVPGAVGGIVIDEDDFEGNACERRLQPLKQRGDVVALVEGGDDDRKLSQCGGLRRVFGARSDGFIHAASVYPIAPGEAKAQFPEHQWRGA